MTTTTTTTNPQDPSKAGVSTLQMALKLRNKVTAIHWPCVYNSWVLGSDTGCYQSHRDKQQELRAHELWTSCDLRPGIPVPNSPYGLCGRKATLNVITAAL